MIELVLLALKLKFKFLELLYIPTACKTVCAAIVLEPTTKLGRPWRSGPVGRPTTPVVVTGTLSTQFEKIGFGFASLHNNIR
jgi:hypothetical protein